MQLRAAGGAPVVSAAPWDSTASRRPPSRTPSRRGSRGSRCRVAHTAPARARLARPQGTRAASECAAAKVASAGARSPRAAASHVRWTKISLRSTPSRATTRTCVVSVGAGRMLPQPNRVDDVVKTIAPTTRGGGDGAHGRRRCVEGWEPQADGSAAFLPPNRMGRPTSRFTRVARGAMRRLSRRSPRRSRPASSTSRSERSRAFPSDEIRRGAGRAGVRPVRRGARDATSLGTVRAGGLG